MKPLILLALLSSFLYPQIFGDVITGIPDSAPDGFEEWVSPIVTPAKSVAGLQDWASAVARARAFVSQLTLQEKINVTTGTDIFNRCVGNTGTIPRFGWKGLCLEDSPLGVRFADFASAFPAGINVASTWDTGLIEARGAAMGAEHRGKGVNVALGPMTNMGRDVAAGRNWEGFGGDPFLSGVATAYTIQGAQGQGVIACVKHFIGNEQEHFRGGSLASQIYSSDIDDKTAHEVYLWPFGEAVKAGVGSVMCSYNKVNQTQSCQNSKILNGMLKEELGFQGFVTSDWAAAINGVQPALAGMDMDMPGFFAYGLGNQNETDPDDTVNSFWGSALIQAVNNGSVPESRVDDMATRILASWYKMGQDQNYPAVNFDQLTEDTFLNGNLVNEHVNVQSDHYKLIREIGGASTILLKNTNKALPLKAQKIKRLAILGSDAALNPLGANGCSDRGCDMGTLAMGWGSGTANFPYLIDPASAITNYMRTANPSVVIDTVPSDFAPNQASLADTCLVFTNADSGEGYITVDGNAGDRNNLTLWNGGETFVLSVANSCSNTIVIEHVVGAIIMEEWIDHPNITAVLNAGLPGQESGNAIVDVLFGAVNPSARLPYTIAKARTDYPADVLYTSTNATPQIVYSEGVNIDYRHFDAQNITPRFEFGFGLSYTTFTYSGLSVSGSASSRRAIDISSSAASITQSASGSAAPSSAVSIGLSSASSALSSTAALSSVSVSLSTASASSLPTSLSLSISASLNFSSSTASLNSSSPTASLNATATGSVNATATASTNATSTTSAPPAISSPSTQIGGPADLYDTVYTVSFTVHNSGGVDGNEVSQVYLGFPSSAGEPPKVLRGFERTWITAGARATVTIPLRRKDVSIWDVVSQQWIVPSGTFTVFVGASSRDIRLQTTFHV